MRLRKAAMGGATTPNTAPNSTTPFFAGLRRPVRSLPGPQRSPTPKPTPAPTSSSANPEALVLEEAPINSWQLLNPAPLSPSSVAFHSAALRLAAGDTEPQIVIFGGITNVFTNANSLPDQGTYTDALWQFDSDTLQWSNVGAAVQPLSDAPSPRAFHVGQIVRSQSSPPTDYLVVFGGRNTTHLMTDTWVLDMNALHWTLLRRRPGDPAPRWGAGCSVAPEDHTLYMVGGDCSIDGSAPCDMTLYALSISEHDGSLAWRSIPTTAGSPVPPPRMLFFWSLLGIAPLRFVLASGWPVANASATPLSDSFVATIESNAVTWQHSTGNNISLAGGSACPAVLPDGSETVFAVMGIGYSRSFSFVPHSYPASSATVYYFAGLQEGWKELTFSVLADRKSDLQPPASIGQVSLPAGDSVFFLFGGYSTFLGSLLAESHIGVLTTPYSQPGAEAGFLWSHTEQNSLPPGATQSPGAIVNDRFWIIGGWIKVFGAYSSVWALDMAGLSPYWRESKTALPSIAEASPAVIGDSIYLVGGGFQTAAGVATFNRDIYVFDTANEEFTVISSNLTAHRGHSMVGYEQESKLVVFGGYHCGETARLINCESVDHSSAIFYNEVWVWDNTTQLWDNKTRIDPLGAAEGPAARAYHTALIWSHYMYVFGGSNNDFVFGDMWRLDLDRLFARKNPALVWENLGASPAGPRFFQCMVALGSPTTKFIITGGLQFGISAMDKIVAADAEAIYDGWVQSWIYKPQENSWYQLQLTGETPPNQYGTTCVAMGNSFIIFGGQEFITSTLSRSTYVLTLGCNPGSNATDYSEQLCTPCPIGTYSSESGATSCTSCPSGTTTPDVGMTSIDNCSVCVENTCSGHGECRVEIGNTPSCNCDTGYRGQFCDEPFLWIILGSLLGGAGIIVVSYFIYRQVKTMAVQYQQNYSKAKEESELRELLLVSKEKEIKELEDVWQIKPETLVFHRELASGSYGKVSLAEWDNRVVAVKQLHLELIMLSETCLDEFHHEVKQLRTLRHRNIVFFYGAGEMNGVPFLVTEYCHRGALSVVLADKSISIPRARALAFALDAASDLKSPNLLVSQEWIVKVADFGTARIMANMGPARQGGSARTVLGGYGNNTSVYMTTGVGTMLWLAPEILDGSTTYDQRADVYSMGIVLWEIGTRRMPYSECAAMDSFELERAIVTDNKRPDISLVLSFVEPEYIALLQECWDANPQRRPPFSDIVRRLRALAKQ